MKPTWMQKARALAKERLAALGGVAEQLSWVMNAKKADQAEAPATATLYIYDTIGYDFWSGGGVTAKDVVDAIEGAKKAGAKSLDVRILSPGGDVFDGMGIHEALKRCGMKTTAFNDGLCASAATMVALGCSKLIAAPTSTWMMHRAWNMAGGHASDLRAMADLLDKADETIASVYSAKSGKSAEACLKMMTEEKGGPDGNWMNAEECKASGFADEIASVDSDADDDKAKPDDDKDDPSDAAVVRIVAQTQRRLSVAALDRLKNRTTRPAGEERTGQPGAAKQ